MTDAVTLERDSPASTTGRRSRRRVWVVAGVVVVSAGGLLAWRLINPPAPPARPDAEPIPVAAATAATQDVPIYLDGLGTVQGFNAVTVKPMVDGQLVAIRFREGQDVQPGDVLAQIDPRPYQATLDQMVAKQAQDMAQLANARIDLARYQKLVATNYTTAQQADTQKALVAQNEALVRQDQAQIDAARTQLSYTTITAPIPGRTGVRQVDQGNIVHTTDAAGIVVINTLQPISVAFTLPQQDLPAVAAAMARGSVTVLAMQQGAMTGSPTGVLDRGAVAVLDNQVDSATGTIKLKATFPNAGLALWPGGFVNVRLLAETRHAAVVVPPEAVQRGPNGAYVFVLMAGGIARRRAVAVGHQDEQGALITNGVAAGDRVVVDGASRLVDGAHVRVTP